MSDSETNGNIGEQSGPSGSVEDLSEYTDADESVSAPTEILAEFLSAIMLKDYETALKYCKLILHYEPNNATAREFYPFIEEKIELMREQGETDDDSSSDFSDSAPNVGSNSSLSSGEESESKETDSDATSASYSSLEDEEADRENNVIEIGNSPLTSNDIVNGNTERPKILSENLSGSERIKTELSNGNEELKKKLGNIFGRNQILSSEQLKLSPVMRKRISSRLILPNVRILNDEKTNDIINNTRSNFSPHGSTKTSSFDPSGEIDQIRQFAENEANRAMFSSDSESPTDPTVHELKK